MFDTATQFPAPASRKAGYPLAIAGRPTSLRAYRRRVERKLRPRVAVLIHLATVASFALDGPDPESAIDDVRALRDRCDEALAAAGGT